MADTKISDLPAWDPTGSAPTLPMDQDGATVKRTEPMEYVAALTQSGTDAPTAVVLRNTLGATVTFSRNDSGDYAATASAAVFADGRTSAHVYGASGIGLDCRAYRNGGSEVAVRSYQDGSLADDVFDGSFLLSITVYP